jgi:hypothetical protein
MELQRYMKDITEPFRQFRECARIVWNAFLRTYPDGEHGFSSIEHELFNAMVYGQMEKYESERIECGHQYAPGIMIVPEPDAHALVGSEDESRVEWTPVVLDRKIKLCYAALFDFDTLTGSYRDFRYVEAVIVASDHYTLTLGQRVLVEAHKVRAYDVSADNLEVPSDWN